MIESAVMRVRATTEICDVVNFERRRQEVVPIHNCDHETATCAALRACPNEAAHRIGSEVGVCRS